MNTAARRLFWTGELTALVQELNNTKLSRAQIADEIFRQTGVSFTRNAIIGKLGRLGATSPKVFVARGPTLARPKRTSVNGSGIIDKIKVRAAAQAHPAFTPGPQNKQALVAITRRENSDRAAALNAQSAPAPLHIFFLDRKDNECAFICSVDGAPRTVCGHEQVIIPRGKTLAPSSYCAFHHAFTHWDPHQKAAPKQEIAA
jgi:hypothetical protein